MRGTWRWFAPLAGLPPDLPTPHAADLGAAITVALGRIALGRIDGTADGERVGGSLIVQPGARPGVEAQLSVAAIDLGGLDAAAAQALRRAVATTDLSLWLRADTASWGRVRAQHLALDAMSDAAGVQLQRLTMRLDGAAVTASGQLGADGRADARVDLATPDSTGLAALLPAGWRLPGLFRGAGRLELAVSGKPAALATRLHVALGALRLDASPTLNLPAGSETGAVALAGPDAAGLLAALGLRQTAWLGVGPVALHGTVSAAAGRVTADDLGLAAGALRADGHLALAWTGTGPHLSGTLDAASLPLPWPKLRGDRPLALVATLAAHPIWSGALRIAAARVLDGNVTVMRDAGGRLALGGGTLRLDGLTADLGGGRLDGTLTLDAAQAPPRLAAHLHLAGAHVASPVLGLPLDLAAAGQADATLDATASGYSAAALLATLAGRVEARAKDGSVTGFDLPALHVALAGDPMKARSLAAKALAGGTSPFTQLHIGAVLDRGNLMLGTGEMTAPDGAASLAGAAALAAGALNLRLSLHPAGDGLPEVGLLLSGSQAAPQRVPELASLAAWLATRR